MQVQAAKRIALSQLARGALAVLARPVVVAAIAGAGIMYSIENGIPIFTRETGVNSPALSCADGCYRAGNFYAEQPQAAADAFIAHMSYILDRCEPTGVGENIKCYVRATQGGSLLSFNVSLTYSGSISCGAGQMYSGYSGGCVSDTFSEGDPVYTSISADQVAGAFSDYLAGSPEAISDLVQDFTANPDAAIDQAIYANPVEVSYTGPSQVAGTMPDGSTWQQSVSYNPNGIYLGQPLVTRPDGSTYTDYTSTEAVTDPVSGNAGDTTENIDMSGVEERLDVIIENTAHLPAPMPSHTVNQNQTIVEVMQAFQLRLNQAPVVVALSAFGTVVGEGGVCPALQFDLTDAGMGNIATSIHCDLADQTRDVISPVMMFFYSFIAFRIFASA